MKLGSVLRLAGIAAALAAFAPELAEANQGDPLADCGLLRDALILAAGYMTAGRVPPPLRRGDNSGNPAGD